MNNNIIKLAVVELNDNQNIVKVAGILRRLKNWLSKTFDAEQSAKISNFVSQTSDLKSLLASTFKSIKEVESAINDYDIAAYNEHLDKLKQTVQSLSKSLGNIEDNTEAAKVPEEAVQGYIAKGRENRLMNEPRLRAPLDEYADKYKLFLGKTLKEFGLANNIDISYPKDITESSIGVTGIHASWAFLDNVVQQLTEADELLAIQKALKDEDLRELFYRNIPNYRIVKVEGRELNASNIKKRGMVELLVRAQTFQRLPPPVDDWQLRAEFWIVDYGEPGKSNNYHIYRQRIIDARRRK